MDPSHLTFKQRYYASLIILGAGILLYRTISMLAGGAINVLVWWVSLLLLAEMIIDASCIVSAIPWWIRNAKEKERLPLRLGAAAALLHAFRVLIFILGRTGPWLNFDVRPEQRAMHADRWTWGGVYFAGILSVLGILGVLIIWRIRSGREKTRFTSTGNH